MFYFILFLLEVSEVQDIGCLVCLKLKYVKYKRGSFIDFVARLNLSIQMYMPSCMIKCF